METTSTIILGLLACLVIVIADAIVCAALSLLPGIAFGSAFRTGLLALIIVPLAIAYGILIERNCYKVNEVELSFENLPESFDGYRIVQLSDIHSRSFLNRIPSLSRAVDKVNSLDADLVTFTGDVITMEPGELEATAPQLSRLRGKDGVLSVLGNHDYCIYAGHKGETLPDSLGVQKVIEKERNMGWDLLMDENRTIRRGEDCMAVVGVQNTSPSRHFPSKGDLAAASAGTDGMFRILLSHDPMHWDAEVVGKDYPLTLSGHTHAVQFSLLGWCPSRYMFRQYRGLYENGSQKLCVNVGLGETIVPFRIGTTPEITLITLRRI